MTCTTKTRSIEDLNAKVLYTGGLHYSSKYLDGLESSFLVLPEVIRLT